MGDKQYRDLSDEVKELHWDLITIKPDQRSYGLLKSCPLDPNAWIVRRVLVERLQLDLDIELKHVERLLRNDAKNYHKWYHRRWVAQKVGPSAASKELQFTEKIIRKDANNFAAWFHRRWVLQEFGGEWEHELAYCDKILGENSSCSCAWEQRYFLVKWSEAFTKVEEVDYALKFLFLKPEDECPWAYIRRHYLDDLRSLDYDHKVPAACVSVLENEINNAQSVDDASWINRRACLNALQMSCDLINSGYVTTHVGIIDQVRTLHQSPLGFVDELCSTSEGKRVWIRLVNTWRLHMTSAGETIGLFSG